MTVAVDRKKHLVDELFKLAINDGLYIIGDPEDFHARNLTREFILDNYSIKELKKMIIMNMKDTEDNDYLLGLVDDHPLDENTSNTDENIEKLDENLTNTVIKENSKEDNATPTPKIVKIKDNNKSIPDADDSKVDDDTTTDIKGYSKNESPSLASKTKEKQKDFSQGLINRVDVKAMKNEIIAKIMMVIQSQSISYIGGRFKLNCENENIESLFTDYYLFELKEILSIVRGFDIQTADVIPTTEFYSNPADKNETPEQTKPTQPKNKTLKLPKETKPPKSTTIISANESLDDFIDDDLEIDEEPTTEELKGKVLDEIMFEVESKVIKYIGEGFNIDFEIDTKEDLFDTFDLKQLNNMLNHVQGMASQLKDDEVYINVLEIVDRFKDGAIKKIIQTSEIPWWRKNYPKAVIRVTAEDTIDTVYEKAKTARDNFHRDTVDYQKMYDFMHELTEEMVPNQEEETNIPSDEESDAAEFVRACVEAIILPHHEALDKYKQSGGNIVYGNLWNTLFTEKLKVEVRTRDDHKCVVCDEDKGLHVHHKIPRKLGGIHHKHNLVTLCSSCHSVIETADLEVAYKKCLSNYLKQKVYLRKSVDLKKDIYILKKEVTDTLETVLFALDNRNEQELVDELIGIIKKVDYLFNN